MANNCGVGTSTQDAEAFTQNVVKTLKVREITPQKVQLNGQLLTIWDNAYGPKSSVILADFGRGNGVILQPIDGFREPSRR